MIKHALITGANGFLGRYTARQFATAGYSVTGIGHGKWNDDELAQFGIADWHTADITIDSLTAYANKPDVIVHCAGSGSVAYSINNPHEDYRRTVESTAAVLEYIRTKSRHTALVYPSSAAVYGNTTILPIKESTALQPSSPYGTHKRMAEILCQSYASNFNISVAMVRFFSIYGDGLKKQLLWDACAKIKRNEYEFFGTGEELRDWLHVEDAAKLLVTASTFATNACPVANGGTGIATTVKDVLTELFTNFELTSLPEFSKGEKAGDPQNYQAEILIAKTWGWSPTIELCRGIKNYAHWIKGEPL